MATVLLRRSQTAGGAPSSLQSGEIAINEADGKLFWRAVSGSVIAFQFGAYATVASPTFTGKATTAASVAGGAGLNVPHGVAPTAPVNGDVWTTTNGLFARVNGNSLTFAALQGTNVFYASQTVQAATVATSAQLFLSPPSGTLAQEAKLRFGSTFSSGTTDSGVRLTASVRVGMTVNWGTGYYDIWLNNGANDDRSDANQRRVVRFNEDLSVVFAGANLTAAGNTVWHAGNVGGTANRITVGATTIDIASNYVGQATITTLGTVATGVWSATAIGINKGGTGGDLSGLSNGALLKKSGSTFVAAVADTDFLTPNSDIDGGTF